MMDKLYYELNVSIDNTIETMEFIIYCDVEEWELKFIHPITGMECQELQQWAAGWSEVDPTSEFLKEVIIRSDKLFNLNYHFNIIDVALNLDVNESDTQIIKYEGINTKIELKRVD